MSDYIKIEDALDTVAHNNVHGEITLNRYDKIIDGIYEIPSADVAPVRHGNWDVREPMPMHDIKGNLSWGNWYVCTGCGFATTAIEGHITQYKYCPSCGARMDGDNSDQK